MAGSLARAIHLLHLGLGLWDRFGIPSTIIDLLFRGNTKAHSISINQWEFGTTEKCWSLVQNCPWKSPLKSTKFF